MTAWDFSNMSDDEDLPAIKLVNSVTDKRTFSPRTNATAPGCRTAEMQRQWANPYVLCTTLTRETQERCAPERWKELCLDERDSLVENHVCPLCLKGPYKHARSLQRHYSERQNMCRTHWTATGVEDPGRKSSSEGERKGRAGQKYIAANRRLSDPFGANERARKRQVYRYKKHAAALEARHDRWKLRD